MLSLRQLFSPKKVAVVRETAGYVRVVLIKPDNSTETKRFPYTRSVAVLHPDEHSNWFIFILDEHEHAAYTFGVCQDRVFSLEIVEGDYTPDDH